MLGQRFLMTSYQKKLFEMDYDKHQRKLEEIKTTTSPSTGKRRTLTTTGAAWNTSNFSEQHHKHLQFYENERVSQIDKANQALLDKLVKISRNQKPPLFKPKESTNHPGTLNSPYRKRELERIAAENASMAKRLISQQGSVNRKQLKVDYVKHKELVKKVQKITSPKSRDRLPPLASPKGGEFRIPNDSIPEGNALEKTHEKEQNNESVEQQEQEKPHHEEKQNAQEEVSKESTAPAAHEAQLDSQPKVESAAKAEEQPKTEEKPKAEETVGPSLGKISGEVHVQEIKAEKRGSEVRDSSKGKRTPVGSQNKVAEAGTSRKISGNNNGTPVNGKRSVVPESVRASTSKTPEKVGSRSKLVDKVETKRSEVQAGINDSKEEIKPTVEKNSSAEVGEAEKPAPVEVAPVEAADTQGEKAASQKEVQENSENKPQEQ